MLEREIYMVANRLIERFGDAAGLRAGLKAVFAEAPKGGTRLH